MSVFIKYPLKINYFDLSYFKEQSENLNFIYQYRNRIPWLYSSQIGNKICLVKKSLIKKVNVFFWYFLCNLALRLERGYTPGHVTVYYSSITLVLWQCQLLKLLEDLLFYLRSIFTIFNLFQIMKKYLW